RRSSDLILLNKINSLMLFILFYTTACNFCLYMVARLQFSALCITHGGVPPRCAQTQTHTHTHLQHLIQVIIMYIIRVFIQLPLSLIHPVSFVNDYLTFYTQRTLEDTDKHIFSQLWLSMSVSKCK